MNNEKKIKVQQSMGLVYFCTGKSLTEEQGLAHTKHPLNPCGKKGGMESLGGKKEGRDNGLDSRSTFSILILKAERYTETRRDRERGLSPHLLVHFPYGCHS